MIAGPRLALFSGEVLNTYRRREDCLLVRTGSAARLQTPRWSLCFQWGPGDTLRLPERELWKLDQAALAHWESFRLMDEHAVGLWLPADAG